MSCNTSHSGKKRALIIGGSIAGMCAAAALSSAFDSVTIIERDELKRSERRRRGVPQAPFVHGLLEQGRRDLESLFPGFTESLVSAGAPVLDFGADVAARRASGWISPSPIGLLTLWPTRYLLESTVRKLLIERYRNVTFMDGSTCVGLILTGDRREVIGAAVVEANREARQEGANLVVDASGSGSKLSTWLRQHDFDQVPEWRVDAKGGYSCRVYRPPIDLPAEWWWKAIVIECAPPKNLVGGVVFPIEGGLWLATLMGFGGHYPPNDPIEFDEFLGRLPSSILSKALQMSAPVSQIYSSRSFANRFRRYNELSRFPAGLTAVGDAVCCFNPIYSQGMTAASRSAVILRKQLAEMDPQHEMFGINFLRKLSSFLEFPWRIATYADSLFSGTEGMQFVHRGMRERYIELLLRAAWRDPALHSRIARVLHMVEPESRFYTCRNAFHVVRSAVASWLSAEHSYFIDDTPPSNQRTSNDSRVLELQRMMEAYHDKASRLPAFK